MQELIATVGMWLTIGVWLMDLLEIPVMWIVEIWRGGTEDE
jgi:hypothetical protein